MDTLPLKHTKWSDRLAFDIALMLEGSGESLDEVIERHTIKVKARAQAEELLTTSWTLIHSPDVSAAVKADLIKSTVKWGGLEPKNDVLAEGGSGGVKITINLGDQEHRATIIDAEPDDEPAAIGTS